MKELSNYGKLGFPNFTSITPAKYTQKQTGTTTEMTKNVRIEKPVFSTVMENGAIVFVCNPDNLMVIGDKIQHPYHKMLSFTVQSIDEERPAKGDWDSHGFLPIMQRCTVTIN